MHEKRQFGGSPVVSVSRSDENSTKKTVVRIVLEGVKILDLCSEDKEIPIMKKVLLLMIIAVAFAGCATDNGGSDWDEWTSRLKKDAPATPKEETPAASQDWAKHNYGQ